MRTKQEGRRTPAGYMLESLAYWRGLFDGVPCYCPDCEGIWY